VRPEVAVGARLDQLSGDADAVARSRDGALDDGIDAQLSGDLGQRPAGALVLHDGSTRDHSQRRKLPEIGNELIGHAIRKVLVGCVTREVLERQHRDRLNKIQGNPTFPGRNADRKNGNRGEDRSDRDVRERRRVSPGGRWGTRRMSLTSEQL
jgi:hypothetical protein